MTVPLYGYGNVMKCHDVYGKTMAVFVLFVCLFVFCCCFLLFLFCYGYDGHVMIVLVKTAML